MNNCNICSIFQRFELLATRSNNAVLFRIHYLAVLAAFLTMNLVMLQNAKAELNSVPELSIIESERFVIEGGKARVKIWASSPASEDLAVKIKLTNRTFVGFPNESLIEGELLRTEILSVGEQSTFVEIQTTQNSIKNKILSFSIAILPGEGYSINDESIYGREIFVFDDDVNSTVVNIAPSSTYTSTYTESQSFVKAGNPVQYKIFVNPPPSHSLTVNLQWITKELKNFSFKNSLPTSILIDPDEVIESGGLYYFQFEVASNGDYHGNRVSYSERISVKLEHGDGYVIGSNPWVSTELMASKSIVSLTKLTNFGIVEGETVLFRLRSFELSYEKLVNVEVSDGSGEFIVGESRRTIKMLAGRYLYTHFHVETEDDSIDEPNGKITVRLLPGEDYTIRNDGQYTSISTISVFDNDSGKVPEISVLANSNEPLRHFSGNANFLLLFNVPPDNSISISYTKEIFSNEILQSYESGFVKVDDLSILQQQDGNFVAILKVEIENDMVFETGGKVTVTLNPDNLVLPGYTVDSTRNKATKAILSDESTPFISIIGDERVEEGEDIRFKLVSYSYPEIDRIILVNVKIENIRGNFLQKEETLQFRFHHQDYRDQLVNLSYSDWYSNPISVPNFFKVKTMENNLVEPDGLVRATVLEGEGYQVGDRPFNQKPDGVAEAIVLNNDSEPSQLSISASSRSVKEDGTVDFFITSTSNSFINVTIRIDCQTFSGIQTGTKKYWRIGGGLGPLPRFYQKRSFWKVVTHPVRQGTEYQSQSGAIHILSWSPTDGCEYREEEGVASSLTVKIQPSFDSSFTIEEGFGVAEVTVDSDRHQVLPEISIRSLWDAVVVEGESMNFLLWANNITPMSDLEIGVIYENSNGFLGDNQQHTLIFPANKDSFEFSIPTIDDELVESDAEITVSIQSGKGYSVADLPSGNASVLVLDDDELPVISIDSQYSTVENENAEFQITRLNSNSMVMDAAFEVEYVVSETGDMLKTAAGVHTFTIDSNPGTILLELEDDLIVETSSMLTVELLESTEYKLKKRTAYIRVRDNDDPEVSISTVEGSTDEFEVNLNQPFVKRSLVVVHVENADVVSDTVILNKRYYRNYRPRFELLFRPGESNRKFKIVIVNSAPISAWIGESKGYNVANSPRNLARLSATKPVVSIRALKSETGQSTYLPKYEIADFEISVSKELNYDLNVDLAVIFEGFVDRVKINRTIVIERGTDKVKFEVNPLQAFDGNLRGVRVKIEESENYILHEYNMNESYSYLNIVSIARIEGTIDEFEVNWTPISSGYKTVSVKLENDSNSEIIHLQFIQGVQTARFKMPAGYTKATLIVENFNKSDYAVAQPPHDSASVYDPLIESLPEALISVEERPIAGVESADEEIQEVDGSVGVTELPDQTSDGKSTYKSGDSGTEVVGVGDDDDYPMISIRPTVNSILEGESAVFILSSTKKLQDDLEINVVVVESGNVISGPIADSVILAAGQEETQLAIATQDDLTNEERSRVNATLQTGIGYNVAAIPDNNAFVEVADDDQIRLQVRIKPEDDYPNVEPWNGTWTEGLPALVQIATVPENVISNEDLAININVSDTMNKLMNPLPASIVLRAGTDRVELRLPTICNQADENESELTVEIQPGDGYSVVVGKGRSTEKIPDIDIFEPGQTGCPGLNSVTIAAVDTKIAAGDNAEFMVTGNILRGHVQKVNITTANLSGNFLVHPGTMQVRIPIGEYGTTFEVETKAKRKGENGTIISSIGIGPGYVVGDPNMASVGVEIVKRAPLPARSEVLHRYVLRNLLEIGTEQSIESLAERIDFAFDNPGQHQFNLGGAGTVVEMVTHTGELLNSDETDLAAIISGSSFALPLSVESGTNSTTLWGRGFGTDVADTGDWNPVDWQGKLINGQLGIDTRIGLNLLSGVTATSGESTVEFELDEGEDEVGGVYRVYMTGLQSYMAWNSEELNTQLQGSFNYGLGKVEIDYDDHEVETANVQQFAGTFGGSSHLFSSESLISGWQSEFSFRTGGWIARQTVETNDGVIAGATVESGSIRIATEGSFQKHLLTDDSIDQMVSIGTRWDNGVGGKGFGLEVTGSTIYKIPLGIDISGSGQFLYSTGASGTHPGVKGEVLYDLNRDGIGIVSSISPSWGELDHTGDVGILERESFKDSRNYDRSGKFRMESRIGYGIAVLDGVSVITPFISSNMTDGNWKSFEIGSELKMGQGNKIAITAESETRFNGKLNREVSLESKFNW